MYYFFQNEFLKIIGDEKISPRLNADSRPHPLRVESLKHQEFFSNMLVYLKNEIRH